MWWVDEEEKQTAPQVWVPLCSRPLSSAALLLSCCCCRLGSDAASTPQPLLLRFLLTTVMRATVLAVAMVIASVAAAQEDVRPQRDFNLQRFAGRWYRVGLAYASEKFAPYRDKLKASMGVVTALPDGNVNLTMYDATPLGCLVKVYQYQKTNVAGQFTYFSTRHNLVKDITVVETNYTDYALVVKHKVFNREYTQVALYGRSTAVRPTLLDRFRSFALSQGFPRESILTPPPAENCPPSESGL